MARKTPNQRMAPAGYLDMRHDVDATIRPLGLLFDVHELDHGHLLQQQAKRFRSTVFQRFH